MQHRLSLAMGLLICGLALPTTASASLCRSRLFSVSPSNFLLTEHEPFEGYLLGEVPMFLPGETVISAHGIAANWDTEELFVLLEVAGVAGSYLGMVDPDTAVVTPIGATGMTFENLSVGLGGVLHAVTGEVGPNPESIFTLSPVDGTPTFFCTLGFGDDGEAIAYSFWEDVMYHVSGSSGPWVPSTDTGVVFSQLTISGPLPCIPTQIALDPQLTDDTCAALAVLGEGLLSWKQGSGPGPIFVVDPWDGSIVYTGFSPVAISGLAVLPLCGSSYFLRGDANNDNFMNIADAVALLGWLFTGATAPECEAAADVNDDDLHTIADPIYLLNSLFVPVSPPPPPPHPVCGFDPSPFLTCDVSACP